MDKYFLECFTHLALGEGSSASASNFHGIGGADKLFEVGVLEVLTEAGFLFLDLTAAKGRWWTRSCDCADTRAQLRRAACHCHCYLCLGQKQHQQSAYCDESCLHFHSERAKDIDCVCVREIERNGEIRNLGCVLHLPGVPSHL